MHHMLFQISLPLHAVCQSVKSQFIFISERNEKVHTNTAVYSISMKKKSDTKKDNKKMKPGESGCVDAGE